MDYIKYLYGRTKGRQNGDMKYRRALFISLPALFMLINTDSVPSAEGLRSVTVVRMETHPVIDGRLDDEC